MLPNLIVIGAIKCGTTSLHYYLDQHPEIKMSSPKEVGFFDTPRNWEKGTRWYESHFKGHAKIFGETTPSYTTYPFPRGIPKKMHSIIPDVKLIYIVRDPIERIISHYLQHYKKRLRHISLEQALLDFDHNYLAVASKYFMQLKQYLEYFPLERIHIISLEELETNPFGIMKKLFSFLGVDNSFETPVFREKLHTSQLNGPKKLPAVILDKTLLAYKIGGYLPKPMVRIYQSLTREKVKLPLLKDDLKNRLTDYLKADILSLRQLTGYDFKGWSI